jgi:hypothetical protein
MNLTPRAPWGGERASHLVGETTDAETEIESSEFLKPGTGEYLTNSIVSCSKSQKGSLWQGHAFLSVPGTYDLHVPFDVGVRSKPGFISNQNTCALTTNEQPQTMHISEFLK